MKNLIALVSGVVVLVLSGGLSAGSDPKDKDFSSLNSLNADPLTGKRYFGAIKVSTLQVLFSEAPFAFELFGRKSMSVQLQAGIVFPLKPESFLQQFFESSGVNATASSEGLISYRNSPYNNHGFSFKFELRKYVKDLYYAPQVMYKHVFYDENVFRLSRGDRTVKQTESKSANVVGMGFMIGRQTYFMGQATDWYVGIGFRARYNSATIMRLNDPELPEPIIYPDFREDKFTFYPFFNFGFRTGFVL